MKDIAVIHPLKHHIYNSIYGISKCEHANVKAFLGMYDDNIFLKKVLKVLKKDDKLKGYYNENINTYVYTKLGVELLFLLSNYNVKFNSIYRYFFEKKAKKYVKGADIVHFMQDYCNETIRYAKKNNKMIVYEQIIAFDTTIKRYLYEEVKKWGFEESYIERNYNLGKIEKAKENIQLVDYIISPSKFVTESLTSEFGKQISKKIIEFPYGIDTCKFIPKENEINSEVLNLLCVSRVTLSKGTQYLIEAMSNIKNDNIHLTYIGIPTDYEDIKLVNKMKESKNITYIPSVPHYKINEYFMKSDIFILPSLIEGSALTIYEALASGLPCIVTKNTGSVIENGKEGFIISPQSSDEIIEKIDFCYRNKIRLKEMSILARKTAEKYSWQNYELNMKNFYNKILKN